MNSPGYLKAVSRELMGRARSVFPPRLMKIRPGINFVCFGITDTCVLKCKMCHKWKGDIFIKEGAKTPTLKDWKNCVSSLREIAEGSLQLNFGGGEPFLRQDTLEIVAFSKSHGFKTNIASNGYLIDDARAKEIGRSGLDSIILSLDSLAEETHDYLRGVQGAHRKVMEALELLNRYADGLYKGLCCVIYDRNLEDVLSLAEWVDRDNRVNSIYFMAAMQPNNTVFDSRWYQKEEFGMLWPQDTQKVRAIIDELIKRKKQGSKIANQVTQLEAFKLYYRSPQKFVKNTKCDMGSALHISSCGDIFLCYNWERIGNIQSDRLSKLWGAQKTEEVRKKISGCRNNCHFLLNCFFTGDYPFELDYAGAKA